MRQAPEQQAGGQGCGQALPSMVLGDVEADLNAAAADQRRVGRPRHPALSLHIKADAPLDEIARRSEGREVHKVILPPKLFGKIEVHAPDIASSARLLKKPRQMSSREALAGKAVAVHAVQPRPIALPGRLDPARGRGHEEGVVTQAGQQAMPARAGGVAGKVGKGANLDLEGCGPPEIVHQGTAHLGLEDAVDGQVDARHGAEGPDQPEAVVRGQRVFDRHRPLQKWPAPPA